MATKYLDSSGLTYLWGKIKNKFATKVSSPTSGNFAALDSTGNITDSGKKATDFAAVGTSVSIADAATDEYGVHPKSLAAFCCQNGFSTTMKLTSFTTTGGSGLKSPITGKGFPIGCKIYYYDGDIALSGNIGVTNAKLYTSHKQVDGRYTSIDGANLELGNSPTHTQSSVYLHVNVTDNAHWYPYYDARGENDLIVSSNQLQDGHFYIYLGKTVGTNGYEFQLEDNNPLYYCLDGEVLIDWAVYYVEYYANSSHFVTPATNALLNYYLKEDTYTKEEVDELLQTISNFEYKVVNSLPTASASTKGKFYIYNGHRYVTTEDNGTYSWADLGSYDIDLTDYVTKTRFDSELENRPIHQKVTEAQLQDLLDNESWTEGVMYYTVEEE